MSLLTVVPIENGLFAENCYLVFDPDHPDTVIVDPGQEVARFLLEAEKRGRTISAIWLTHAHVDHIQGVGEVRQATDAPIYLHPDDRKLYDSLPQQGMWFGTRLPPPPPPDRELTHGQRLRIGEAEFEVRHTPGHSPGHVCFVTEGFVLGGDVLFQGSIGRTDLPGGNLETLLASIRGSYCRFLTRQLFIQGMGPQLLLGASVPSIHF